MRKTDEQILQEYFHLMKINDSLDIREFWLKMVAAARSEEPRINSGVHYCDWCNICDDDDDFDSFYGDDYFKDEDTGLEPVEFYDPHPGLLGCPYPIPESVRLVANELNGTVITLDKAMRKVKNALPVSLESIFLVTAKRDIIMLHEQKMNKEENMWRVLRYRDK